MLIQLQRSAYKYVGTKDVYPLNGVVVSTINPTSKYARINVRAAGTATEMADAPERKAYISMSLVEAQVLMNKLAIAIEAARVARSIDDKVDLV